MLAVTMQFGVTAEEVSLFGLIAGKPVKLTRVLAKAVSWMISREGCLLLVLYNAQAKRSPGIVPFSVILDCAAFVRAMSAAFGEQT